MQPNGTGNGDGWTHSRHALCAGVPNDGLLYHSLKSYLDSKTRQQPIIGLDTITECVKAGSGDPPKTFYLCEVCESRMGRSDIRNHMVGSLHRYKYIKARHPSLAVGWGHAVDMPKLAWPLMEMAGVLEKREGPGAMQLLQLDGITFQEMQQNTVRLAVSRLAAVRYEQMHRRTLRPSIHTQTSSLQRGEAVQPQRVELPGQGTSSPGQSQRHGSRRRRHVEVEMADVAEAKATSSIELPVKKSSEPSVKSERRRHNILDGHSVIGLDFVVECRKKEDGHPSCFLCHCCRIKCNPGDIVDHLTSSSHISNYLMEAYPECVDTMMGGLNGEPELLQSVAQRVAAIEERKRHKVLDLPARRCDQLADKTYHWCIRKFSDGEQWTAVEKQKKKTVGFRDSGASCRPRTQNEPGPEVALERAGKKHRAGGESDPVFKVSMLLTKGALVLERASFDQADSKSLAIGAPSSPSMPPPPENLQSETTEPKAPTSSSNSDFGPLTVTVFEPPPPVLCTSWLPSPPRHVEVRQADIPVENISVIVGRRTEVELQTTATQASGAKESPVHDPCCLPERPHLETYIYNALPADPSPSEAVDDAPPPCYVPAPSGHEAHQKPAITFYYYTPGGQKQP